MKLQDYINGQRKGKEANRIERDSMTDPFLYEALEGYDSVEGDHAATLLRLQSKIGSKAIEKKRNSLVWQSAAAVAVVFLFGGYLLLQGHKTGLQAQTSNNIEIISIYVPEDFYKENIVLIAKGNTAEIKKYKPNISRFSIDNDDDISIDLDSELLAQNSKPLDIYMPKAIDAEKINRQNEAASSKSVIDIANSSMLLAAAEEVSAKKDHAVENAVEMEQMQLERESISNENKDSGDSTPKPLIGFKKYNEYLNKSLNRSMVEDCNSKHGTVEIGFLVDKDGVPHDFIIYKSLCYLADKEAIHIIRIGPKWSNGNERVKVEVKF